MWRNPILLCMVVALHLVIFIFILNQSDICYELHTYLDSLLSVLVVERQTKARHSALHILGMVMYIRLTTLF